MTLLLLLLGCGDPKCELPAVYADQDGDGHGDPSRPFGGCDARAGTVAEATDCDDTDGSRHPGAPESCDGVDHDCDGVVDEGGTPWYADLDHDGYGDPGDAVIACTAPPARVADATDCAPDDPAVHPGATERCDDADLDEDCDGLADDADPDVVGTVSGYRDEDADGWGGAAAESCDDDLAATPGDCDDADPSTFPGAPLVCGDPSDHNCDGAADAPDVDTDGDGSPACEDCDDTDDDALPGEVEVCDGIDNDCDGAVDGPLALDAVRVAPDRDGDGYGDAERVGWACEAPWLWSDDPTDCDDSDWSIRPGAPEDCGTDLDENCNGVTNEVGAYACVDWFLDADGDGYGSGAGRCQCAADATYTTAADGDCADADPSISPGAPDVSFDGVDQDCDGADLAHPSDFDVVAYGPADSVQYGSAAATGDLTGDGVLDLAVGDEGASGTDGRAVIHAGPLDAGPSLPTFTIASVPGTTSYGAELVIGDLDGDGADDLIGPTQWSDWGGLPNSGAVFVHAGPIRADTDVSAATLLVRGPWSQTVSTYAAIVDDIDGDGVRELAVGSAYLGRHGSVVLVPGDATGEVDASTATVGVEGSGADDMFGTGAASADWNGDGVADLVVGAQYSGADGAVYLYAGPITELLPVSAADVTWVGGGSGAAFGDEVYALGDLDGDGIDDVGARGETDAAVLAAVTPGTYAMADSTATFRDAVDAVGGPVAPGDYDGDGAIDLLLTATETDTFPDGQCLLFLGPLSGPYVPEDADWVASGDAPTAAFGALGDFDGDGRDDVILGIPDVATHAGAGVAVLLRGGDLP